MSHGYYRMVVRNLPGWITKKTLVENFADVRPSGSDLLTQRGEFSGIGFLHFKSFEDAVHCAQTVRERFLVRDDCVTPSRVTLSADFDSPLLVGNTSESGHEPTRHEAYAAAKNSALGGGRSTGNHSKLVVNDLNEKKTIYRRKAPGGFPHDNRR